MNSSAEATIGIDVGGTAIKSGLLTREGEILARRVIETGAGEGPDRVIERIAELVRGLQADGRALSRVVVGIGIGMPGTLDRARGVVIAPPNLPGWREVAIVDRLRSLCGIGAELDNDANCAAMAEHVRGSGRGTRDMVLLTLGTGVGGGVILDGRIWHGRKGGAGEIGHMIVSPGGRRCACGQEGCLEAYASASNTAARAMERIAAGGVSRLSGVLEKRGRLRAEDVLDEARGGDELARGVWEETCYFLGMACVNLQRLLDPERIVLSGGMSAAGEGLRGPVMGAMRRISSSMMGEPVEVRVAELGNDAGFVGAGLLGWGGGS